MREVIVCVVFFGWLIALLVEDSHHERTAVAYERGKSEGIMIGQNFHAIDALVQTIDGACYQYLGWRDGHVIRNMDTLVVSLVQTEPLTEVKACGELVPGD